MLLILISTSIHDFILFIATAGCIETSSFLFFRWTGDAAGSSSQGAAKVLGSLLLLWLSSPMNLVISQ